MKVFLNTGVASQNFNYEEGEQEIEDALAKVFILNGWAHEITEDTVEKKKTKIKLRSKKEHK